MEEYIEANKALDNCWESEIFSMSQVQQYNSKVFELYGKKYKDFKAWVEVEKAILRCGFTDIVAKEAIEYNIRIFDCDGDPYEVPSQAETDAWNRGEISEFLYFCNGCLTDPDSDE